MHILLIAWLFYKNYINFTLCKETSGPWGWFGIMSNGVL